MVPIRLLACAALACSTPALAQDEDPAPSDEILVTAPELRARTVTRRARAITPPPQGDYRHEPLPRFESALCPAVVGLTGHLPLLIVDRIRRRIAQLELPLGDARSCTPNILVAFVRDGESELATLRHDRHFLLAGLSREERLAIVADPGPVYAWTATTVRDRHGDNVAGRPPQVATDSSPRLQLSIRRDIDLAVVVIDYGAILGKTTDQLGDYAAMRTLARTRPPADAADADTILALFTPDADPPAQMTAFDLAYLTSLYTSRANESAVTKMSRIASVLRNPDEPRD